MWPKVVAKGVRKVENSFVDLTTPPEAGGQQGGVSKHAISAQQATTDSDSDDFMQPTSSVAASKRKGAKATEPQATKATKAAKPNNPEAIHSDTTEILSLKPPLSSDSEKLNKLRAELSDISRKEAALRLREKKVRADLKKLQKRVHKALAPAQFVAEEDVGEIEGAVGALFPVQKAAELSQETVALLEDEGEGRGDHAASPTLWRMAQQASGFEEGVDALLGTLKSTSSLVALPLPLLARSVMQKRTAVAGVDGAVGPATDSETATAGEREGEGEGEGEGGGAPCDGAKGAHAPQVTRKCDWAQLLTALGAAAGASGVVGGGDTDTMGSLLVELEALQQQPTSEEPCPSSDCLHCLYDRINALLQTYVPSALSPTGAQAAWQQGAGAVAALQAVLRELQANLQAIRGNGNTSAASPRFIQHAIASCFAARIFGCAASMDPSAAAVVPLWVNTLGTEHAEIDSLYPDHDSFSEGQDGVMHYVPAPAPAGAGGAGAGASTVVQMLQVPSAVVLLDLTQASSNASQEQEQGQESVPASPDFAAAALERMTPQELFSTAVETLPDFAALSLHKLQELGAHFGLKYSVNLPRILCDIWTRMRNTSPGPGPGKVGRGGRGTAKVKASGAKRDLGAVSSDADEPAKKQKSKASSSSTARGDPEMAPAPAASSSSASDAHDAAIRQATHTMLQSPPRCSQKCVQTFTRRC